jgi:hypothetical protein
MRGDQHLGKSSKSQTEYEAQERKSGLRITRNLTVSRLLSVYIRSKKLSRGPESIYTLKHGQCVARDRLDDEFLYEYGSLS